VKIIDTTTIGKYSECPKYNEKITIIGHYKYTENPYEVKFRYALCPIKDKDKLPINEEYDSYCCNDVNCKVLHNFKKYIDINKNGYSS